MAKIRVQVAIHFEFDPATQLADIPEEITKTIAIGDELIASKVPASSISLADTTKIILEMDKQVFEAQKKAKPVKKSAPVATAAEKEGENGSLFA